LRDPEFQLPPAEQEVGQSAVRGLKTGGGAGEKTTDSQWRGSRLQRGAGNSSRTSKKHCGKGGIESTWTYGKTVLHHRSESQQTRFFAACSMKRRRRRSTPERPFCFSRRLFPISATVIGGMQQNASICSTIEPRWFHALPAGKM